MWFVNDAIEWGLYELSVRDRLESDFWIKFEKNTDKMWVDLLHPLFTAEVKFDRLVEKTGNLFIEIWYKWGDSGLFKDNNVDLFVCWNKSFALVFKVNTLKKDLLDGVEDGKFKTIKGGDGYNSLWVLLPISSAEDMCIAKIDMSIIS